MRTLFAMLTLVASASAPAFGLLPSVNVVPFDPNNPALPHDTWNGRPIRLKGVTDVAGANFRYHWDCGNGTVQPEQAVTNRYVLEFQCTYNGGVNQPFTATLIVRDLNNAADVTSASYFVVVRAVSLNVEANVAIDEGLWYLHKQMSRSGSGLGIEGGWGTAYGITATNLNAFLVNGHREDGQPSNPYQETVKRATNYVLARLATSPISAQINPKGAFNPDANGNGIGVRLNQSNELYQGGMVIDALVATGTPSRLAAVGPANVVNRSYKDIVQDMVDYYAFCQYDPAADFAGGGGGWRYGCNNSNDNSADQWAAIGLLAAIQTPGFNATVDQKVLDHNKDWLVFSQNTTDGTFGYTNSAHLWGPFATTPSGLVQLALNAKGRGDIQWDRAETFIRNSFGNTGTATQTIKSYWYGLFSLTKALLLHDSDGNSFTPGTALADLRSSTAGVQPLDWYGAQVSTGDPTDGVARTIVSRQLAAGNWSGNDYTPEQYPFETGWAIIMLRRTVVIPGPVAVIRASPLFVVSGGRVNFTGKDSFHSVPTLSILQWQWDFTGGTNFTASGVNAVANFTAAPPYPKMQNVRLRVSDNSNPAQTADAVIAITITSPPIGPTANAGGPYNVCSQAAYLPYYLNGTGSSNPDNGQSEPGFPGDFIKEYAWDLDNDGQYDDAFGAQPRIDNLSGIGLGSGQTRNVGLRVTDNTSGSFPSSGLADLQGFATSQVFLRSVNDVFCTKCVSVAQALPKAGIAGRPSTVQLVWTETGAHHYNIIRATVNNGPYELIGTVLNTVNGTGKTMVFVDTTVTVGTTYYYRIAPATLADIDTCQSNQTLTAPLNSPR